MLQELVDAIEKLIITHLNEMHTAIPGEIVEFDPKECVATVKPWGKMVLTNGKEFDYPKINDVPVLFPQGGGQDNVIVYPVKKGDGCLLIFGEQALDYWRSNGTQRSELKFSLSNAVAIPGMFTKPKGDVEDAVNNDCIILRSGSNSIKLSKAKITIRGDIEVEGNLTTTGKLKGSGGVYNASGELLT